MNKLTNPRLYGQCAFIGWRKKNSVQLAKEDELWPVEK